MEQKKKNTETGDPWLRAEVIFMAAKHPVSCRTQFWVSLYQENRLLQKIQRVHFHFKRTFAIFNSPQKYNLPVQYNIWSMSEHILWTGTKDLTPRHASNMAIWRQQFTHSIPYCVKKNLINSKASETMLFHNSFFKNLNVFNTEFESSIDEI